MLCSVQSSFFMIGSRHSAAFAFKQCRSSRRKKRLGSNRFALMHMMLNHSARVSPTTCQRQAIQAALATAGLHWLSVDVVRRAAHRRPAQHQPRRTAARRSTLWICSATSTSGPGHRPQSTPGPGHRPQLTSWIISARSTSVDWSAESVSWGPWCSSKSCRRAWFSGSMGVGIQIGKYDTKVDIFIVSQQDCFVMAPSSF